MLLAYLRLGAHEAERALAFGFYKARDNGETAKTIRCKHGNARTVYWLAAHTTASERVFARMPARILRKQSRTGAPVPDRRLD